MTIQLRGLHPTVRLYAEYAHRIANHFGIEPIVTSTFRPWEEQARLRRRYLQGQSRFPANRPGDSAHNFGLAWDSWVPEEDRAAWAQIREAVGFRVPGNDHVHAEVPQWRRAVGRQG